MERAYVINIKIIFKMKQISGPFLVETDELIDIEKLLEYNKVKHALSIFVGKKRLEKSSSNKKWEKITDSYKVNSKPEIKDFD